MPVMNKRSMGVALMMVASGAFAAFGCGAFVVAADEPAPKKESPARKPEGKPSKQPTEKPNDQPSESPGDKPAKPARPAVSDDPLSGPAVKKVQQKPSLVERDVEGKIVRLQMQPAEAALKLMKFDEATQKKVDEIVLRQTAALDGVVRDNLEAIAKIAGLNQAGNKAEALAAFKELFDKSDVLRRRGGLINQLTGVMSDEQAAELRELVGDYYKARLAEEQEIAKAKGEKYSGVKFTLTEQLQILGQEIKRSYERVFGQQAKEFEELLKTLNLTPEQDAKIHQIVGDSFQKSYGKQSEAEKARVFLRVWEELDTEQRKIVWEKIKEQGKDAMKAARPGVKKDEKK